MNVLTDLWLPVLLSAVLVFIVSSIIHMVLHVHKSDYRKLPGEEKVLEAMRAEGVERGEYVFPCPASMKDMGSPEMVEKYKKGPVGFLTVLPNGPRNMGGNLVQWFLYSILIGIFTGYTARLGLAPGAETMTVFRMTATVAVLGYGFSSIPDSIWRGLSWRTTFKFLIDGVIYGLVTAGTFAWMWPDGM